MKIKNPLLLSFIFLVVLLIFIMNRHGFLTNIKNFIHSNSSNSNVTIQYHTEHHESNRSRNSHHTGAIVAGGAIHHNNKEEEEQQENAEYLAQLYGENQNNSSGNAPSTNQNQQL